MAELRGDRCTITPYRDGPLIVRGDFTILDQEGNVIDPGRKTVALCRCGRSKIKPFCDNTHTLVRFSAEGRDERVPPGAIADRPPA